MCVCVCKKSTHAFVFEAYIAVYLHTSRVCSCTIYQYVHVCMHACMYVCMYVLCMYDM